MASLTFSFNSWLFNSPHFSPRRAFDIALIWWAMTMESFESPDSSFGQYTSVGYTFLPGFADVNGAIVYNRQWSSAETTSSGRSPACSDPRAGSSSAQNICHWKFTIRPPSRRTQYQPPQNPSCSLQDLSWTADLLTLFPSPLRAFLFLVERYIPPLSHPH